MDGITVKRHFIVHLEIIRDPQTFQNRPEGVDKLRRPALETGRMEPTAPRGRIDCIEAMEA